MNIEKATYVYNHEITHDTTGKTPAEIFLYGIKPSKTRKNAIVEYLDYQISVTQITYFKIS